MPEINEYKPNTFCWPELSTTDPAGAKKFYGELLGWELHDDPIGEDMVYTMAAMRGKNVGAMYQLRKEQLDQGVPPNWLSYVSVADVKSTVEKAKALGANVMVAPMDVFTIGSMAVLIDPAGAVFALWQPKEHIGAQLVNEPGAFCWNELHTHDVDKAGGFYTNLFDWGTDVSKTATGTNYTMFLNGKDMAAGMMALPPEMSEVPSNWLVYFAVDNCDDSNGKVAKLGGNTILPPTDIPEIGRFAVCQDPQGAVFAIIALAKQ